MKLFSRSRLLLSSLILVGLVFGMQGCGGGGGGGGGSTTTPVNTSLASAARGYYDGSATIDGGTQVDVTITAPSAQAMFDEKGFVFAFKGTDDGSTAIVLLYKGTFTEVSSTSFKANVRVYVKGIYKMTSTISDGVINAGTSLSGTLVGSGDYANSVGTVSLSYSSDNSVAPPEYLFGTANRWQDADSGDVFFNTATNFDAIFAADTVPSELRNCDAIGVDTANVVTERTGRVRSFTTPAVTGCLNSANNGRILTGYLTNYTNSGGAQDDRLFIVVSDDSYSYVGILPCLNGTCLP
jgi:hypothetical protein